MGRGCIYQTNIRRTAYGVSSRERHPGSLIHAMALYDIHVQKVERFNNPEFAGFAGFASSARSEP